MDPKQFDRLAKSLGHAVSRRGALGALAGLTGLAGVVGNTEYAGAKAKKHRQRKRKAGKRRQQAKSNPAAVPAGDAVAAEAADCLNPGPSSNMNKCNFNNRDFAFADLSSSSMRETKFRGADLTCADLSSSQLKQADFRQANLTLADLSSSGCNGTRFNNAIFCGTKTCNGAVRNDNCPPGVDPDLLCCADDECGFGRVCRGHECCWTSLNAAVEASSNGDTIRLCAGTLPTRSLHIDKSLTVVGAGSGDDPETDTILDAGELGKVFQTAFNVGELEFRDVRITGGNSGSGFGGILNQPGTTLRLVGVAVAGNKAAYGGGIRNEGTLILGNGSRVEGNEATGFGGQGGGIDNLGTATLEAGSAVTGNTAFRQGGGVFERSGEVTVANSGIITANTANGKPNNCAPAGAIPNCVN